MRENETHLRLFHRPVLFILSSTSQSHPLSHFRVWSLTPATAYYNPSGRRNSPYLSHLYKRILYAHNLSILSFHDLRFPSERPNERCCPTKRRKNERERTQQCRTKSATIIQKDLEKSFKTGLESLLEGINDGWLNVQRSTFSSAPNRTS